MENLREELLVTYPETSEKTFAKQIYLKKEFNKNKYTNVDLSDKTYDEVSKNMCNAGNASFKLTNNQVFIKNFISPNTPYNSILLYHGVGVGKTCAAINIAEQFLNIYSKKCLVIMPTSLKENFKKQLFDINNPGHCTGKKYLQMVPDHAKYNKETNEKKINKIINSRYEFMGYLEFAKMVKEHEDKLNSKFSKETAEKKFIEVIKSKFSNRVIIIDEIHNARAEKDETSKKIPSILLKVLQHAENTKLILLTATPMFNGVTEIVWILNYLLANDKQKLLEINNCFDSKGVITQEGIEMITNASSGRVSYMRGENPYTFPFKIYPSETKIDTTYLKVNQIPKKDIYDQDIPKDLRISSAFGKTLSVTHMSKYQYNIYKSLETTKNIDENEDNFDENDNSYNISTMIQASNIVYPSDKSKTNPLECIGKKGFFNNFKIVNSKSGFNFKVEYNQNDNFLATGNLEKYSAKLNAIVDYILNSEGIVYVYSYYVYSALLPLAIALEHRGFRRSNGGTILHNNKSIKSKGDHGFKYSLLTKDANLKTDIQDEINKITAMDNIDGKNIKVILGTSVTAEGINFKRIRQIHIIEPWFHLNKLEQVTGRAIRMCSHIDLPPEKRNVTIYRHAAIKPAEADDFRKECTDLRIYRIAENKQKYINIIEKVLVQNSVDCNLNFPIISFPKDKQIKIKTSQNVAMFKYDVGDRMDDKHIDMKCVNAILKTDKIDSNTFSDKFFIDDIPNYVGLVAEIFKNDPVNTYKEINDKLDIIYKGIDEDLLKFTLEDMISRKTTIRCKESEGYVIYLGRLYMFQPNKIRSKHILTSDRYTNDNNIVQNVIEIGKDNEKLVQIKEENTMFALYQKIQAEFEKYGDIVNESVYYDYFIDRMSYQEFNNMMSEIVNIDESNEVYVNIRDKILSSLESGRILKKSKSRNVYYALNIYSENVDDIYIVDFGKKTYVTGTNVDMFEFTKLDANNKQNITNFKGYISFKKDKRQFKIMLENKKSEGTVCGTGTLNTEIYKKMVNEIDPNVLTSLNGKITNKALCVVLELLMRENNYLGRPHQIEKN